MISRILYLNIVILSFCFSNPNFAVGQVHENKYSTLFNDSLVQIELNISPKGMEKLEQKRQLALYDGYLYTTDKDWVKAKFIYNHDTINAEIRLKGDVYDHWIDPQAWSFKVKLKDGSTFFGMKNFALQRSENRGDINEWLFHQLLNSQGLISLRYDFLKLSVNGNVLAPVYAIEENFDKYLIEHNELKEGIIFQLSNKFYWSTDSWGKNSSPIDSHFGAQLEPYQQKKILKDDKLKNQFKIVRNLMTQYNLGNLSAHEIFDMPKMAKFFVIVDLLGHHHACTHDNMKFYLNPITSLIEPIGYDNQQIYPISEQRLLGEKKSLETLIRLENPSNNDYLMNQIQFNILFSDPVFYKEYLKQLDCITEYSALDSIFNTLKTALARREALIKTTNPKYSFSGLPILLNNASYIKNTILTLNEGDVSGRIIGQNNEMCLIQLLNKKTLPVEINALIIENDTVLLDSSFILQPWMNQNRYAQIEFRFKGNLPKRITVKASIFGLPRVKKSFLIEENIKWGESNNSLSVVPNKKITTKIIDEISFDDELKKQIKKEEEKSFVDSTLSGINVYYKNYSKETQSVTLGVTNLSTSILEIIDLRYFDKWIFEPEEKAYLLGSLYDKAPYYKEMKFKVPQFRWAYGKKIEMSFPWDDKMIADLKLNFRQPGAINNRSQGVFPWTYLDEGFFNSNIIRQEANYKELPFIQYSDIEKKIEIKEGSWIIKKGIKIPSGYTIYCDKNVTLNFTDSSFLLSYSPIIFTGTKEAPIRITSSDTTGMGIVVLNAESTSLFTFVKFSDNKALDQYGMDLTGMVTLYESDVEFHHCEFSNNHSEDMLNIIRSQYTIKDTYFHDIYSDALDCDFSTGKIEQIQFKNIGNDAIDVSGRSMELNNIIIENAGDKGISGGENSIIKGDDISIINSEIGVSAKDMSKINMGRLKLDKVVLNYAVFQKKSEYGPASLVIQKSKNTKNYLLEKNSILIINGEKMTENGTGVSKLLYGKIYGKSSL